MAPSRIILAAALLPLALAGCSGTGDDISRAFGMTRDSPDEFQVTTRAPLSMPPAYTLRPPRPGAPRPQELSMSREAEATLAPQSALAGNQGGSVTPGQQALLAASGPVAPTNIRQQVDRDGALEQTQRGFVDEVMFWRTPQDKSVIVDPQREAQRLRENAALGQSPVTGDTLIIQRKPQSFWSRIF